MVDAVPLDVQPRNPNRTANERNDPEADVNGTATTWEHQVSGGERAAAAARVVGKSRAYLACLQSTGGGSRQDDASRCGVHPEGDPPWRDQNEWSKRRRRLVQSSRRLLARRAA